MGDGTIIPMNLSVFLAFVLATGLMIALPGPSVVLTVAHSVSFGWRRALATVAGETAGIAVQLAVASIGLASLLRAVASSFAWIRWAGAAYLAYVAVRLWFDARSVTEWEASSGSNANLFVQGLVITVPNPKSLLFIAAFLPQFIDADRGLAAQLAIIIPTFLAITFTVTSLWACLASGARAFLKGPKAMMLIKRSAAVLMAAAAAGMLPH